MSELKSCPLCRGRIAFHGDDECSGCHLLVCDDCRAIFDLSNSVDPGNQCESLVSLRQAITLAWNSRAESEEVEPTWIPVDEQSPDDGDQVPVIGYNPDWVDEDTNPEGVRECFLGGGGWINAEWNSYQDVYETRETAPTHWQPMPKAPQQEQK